MERPEPLQPHKVENAASPTPPTEGASSNGPLGQLGLLPRELRDYVYRHVLRNKSPPACGWGRNSGINTSILTACRLINEEATPWLYHSCFLVPITPKTCTECPPASALGKMKSLVLEISYDTKNRGDFESSIVCSGKLQSIIEYVALSLRRSERLKSLTIALYNQMQRKRGPKLARSEAVSQTIRGFLRPFASLPQTVNIMIDGFDVLEYSEMFYDMRTKLAGTDLTTLSFESWQQDEAKLADLARVEQIRR